MSPAKGLSGGHYCHLKLLSVKAQHATLLTEIKGKDRRTYSFNRQNQLVLEQQGSSNHQQGSSSLLTGFKGVALSSDPVNRHACLIWRLSEQAVFTAVGIAIDQVQCRCL